MCKLGKVSIPLDLIGGMTEQFVSLKKKHGLIKDSELVRQLTRGSGLRVYM